MRTLHPIGTHRTIARGLAAAALVAVIVAGCGGDDDSTTTPPPVVTTGQPPAAGAQPDLVISDVSVQPAGPLVPADSVQITATVRNIGAADYAQRIVVQAPGNHTGGFNGLAAGASDVALIDFPVVSPDVTYTLSLVVDPDNVIAESNESNNESVTIQISTLP